VVHNPELSVIKLLKMRLYYRPRVANTCRLMLTMVPRCLGTKSPRRSWSKILILYIF